MPRQYLLIIIDEPGAPFGEENPPNLLEAYSYRKHFDADGARAQAEAEAWAAEYATRHGLTGVIGYAWTES